MQRVRVVLPIAQIIIEVVASISPFALSTLHILTFKLPV